MEEKKILCCLKNNKKYKKLDGEFQKNKNKQNYDNLVKYYKKFFLQACLYLKKTIIFSVMDDNMVPFYNCLSNTNTWKNYKQNKIYMPNNYAYNNSILCLTEKDYNKRLDNNIFTFSMKCGQVVTGQGTSGGSNSSGSSSNTATIAISSVVAISALIVGIILYGPGKTEGETDGEIPKLLISGDKLTTKWGIKLEKFDKSDGNRVYAFFDKEKKEYTIYQTKEEFKFSDGKYEISGDVKKYTYEEFSTKHPDYQKLFDLLDKGELENKKLDKFVLEFIIL